uniref:Reverse transcriptase Ty1/copia-type domain-containing protein n=1 Tax=Fagus sylvatica TaxID=28930 RepID=A0A2N9H4G9_FAGSY
MGTEFNAIKKCGTWSLVEYSPSMNVLSNKWVYKIKKKSDGSIKRYKARLVANGFHQQEGLDYSEMFSPVVKHTTIRVDLALALHQSWPIRQLDVQNAFLHGHLTEEVYMCQPRGFEDPMFPNHVCKLHRSLYGLKQAPRAWFQRFSDYLEDLGFVGSRADYSLFTYHHNSITILLLIYVDGILLTSNSESHLLKLITDLGHFFSMKDLGRLHYFLGLKAIFTAQGLSLTQTKYAFDLLQRTNMSHAKPCTSPATSGKKLAMFDGDHLPDPIEYRSVVGALQYLTLTRPDLSFAVNQAWSFDDRRSTGGYYVYLGANLISWNAKKQSIVSRSSIESEYRQLAHTAVEISWLRHLMKDLRVFLPTPIIWCDNFSSISLASNPVMHARTKHLEVDYHYVREKVVHKELDICYICSDDQVVDVFTKELSTPRFEKPKAKLMVRQRPIILQRCINQVIKPPDHPPNQAKSVID